MASRWTTFVPELSSRFRSHLKERVPKCPGVYALYDRSSLFYIGCTTNLRSRLESHILTHGQYSVEESPGIWPSYWHSTGYLVIKYSIPFKHGDWATREIRLLTRVRPRRNKLFVGQTGKDIYGLAR